MMLSRAQIKKHSKGSGYESSDIEDYNNEDDVEFNATAISEVMSQYEPNKSNNKNNNNGNNNGYSYGDDDENDDNDNKDRRVLFLDCMDISQESLKVLKAEIKKLDTSTRPTEVCMENVRLARNIRVALTQFFKLKELRRVVLLGDRDAQPPLYAGASQSLETYSSVLSALRRLSDSTKTELIQPSNIRTLRIARMHLTGEAIGQRVIAAITYALTDLHLTHNAIDLPFVQGLASPTPSCHSESRGSTTFSTSLLTSNRSASSTGTTSIMTTTTPDSTMEELSRQPARPAPLRLLELSHCRVTDSMIHVLAQHNQWQEHCLQVLNLKSNHLKAASLSGLTLLLQQQRESLLELTLSGNPNLFVNPAPLPRLWWNFLAALAMVRNLASVDVHDCPMTAHQASQLLSSLPSPSCHRFNLNHTQLFQEEEQEGANDNEIDQEDDGNNNNTTNDDSTTATTNTATDSLFRALEKNTAVWHLNLEGCGITNAQIVPLFRALERNTTLRTLHLADNDFDVTCGWEQSLPHLSTLLELHLPRGPAPLQQQQDDTNNKRKAEQQQQDRRRRGGAADAMEDADWSRLSITAVQEQPTKQQLEKEQKEQAKKRKEQQEEEHATWVCFYKELLQNHSLVVLTGSPFLNNDKDAIAVPGGSGGGGASQDNKDGTTRNNNNMTTKDDHDNNNNNNNGTTTNNNNDKAGPPNRKNNKNKKKGRNEDNKNKKNKNNDDGNEEEEEEEDDNDNSHRAELIQEILQRNQRRWERRQHRGSCVVM